MNKNRLMTILSWLIFPVLLLTVFTMFNKKKEPEKQEYYQIIELFEADKIDSFTLNLASGKLTYILRAEKEEADKKNAENPDAKDKAKPREHAYTVASVDLFKDSVIKIVDEHNRLRREEWAKANPPSTTAPVPTTVAGTTKAPGAATTAPSGSAALESTTVPAAEPSGGCGGFIGRLRDRYAPSTAAPSGTTVPESTTVPSTAATTTAPSGTTVSESATAPSGSAALESTTVPVTEPSGGCGAFGGIRDRFAPTTAAPSGTTAPAAQEDELIPGIIKYDITKESMGSVMLGFLPTALMGILMVVLVVVMYRNMNKTMTNETNRSIAFGKARTRKGKDEKRKTTFDDVAGADEEKEELSEIVEFLKNPQKFNEIGARIPKGVLLVGPPGTGKTLLARAVAGEADVPFFSISGSDFVEMYVGVGASRVRDLFEQAKHDSPAIIFIDEIDAVGRHRGAGMGGGHDEREQTLNQLLVEMDGFGANEGVIIIAATNRPDILDPALLRPGRFDRQVTVGYPDIKGREEILKVHAKGKPFAHDVKLPVIARATVGFTGADLENLLNEAALMAARRGKRAITMSEIDEASIKVQLGTEKRSHKLTDKEKRLTAYHEAGHAVAGYYLENADKVHQVSIIPRGMAGGYTLHLPSEDRDTISKSEMLDRLIILLGGRAAEAIVLGDISTGASNDLQRATDMTRKMITKYGMSDALGPLTYGGEQNEVFLGRDYTSHSRDYSERVASEIDAEMNRVITRAYERTEEILTQHRDKLDAVANTLLEKEKIDGEAFTAIMEDEESKD